MTGAVAPSHPPLVAIVGPTAVGKSNLAIRLATLFDGEIVCADSRTQYRAMDIGTAKPTRDQQAAVRHHLLDLIDPDESFTLAQFQGLAYRAVADITQRGRIPFLVGGSGLYVKSVVEGFHIPQMEPDPALRRSLADDAEYLGPQHLYDELLRVDPAAARHIQPTNVRRVIRALEVYRRLGVPISQAQTKSPPPYRILMLGLTRSMENLERAIGQRVDAMLAEGLLAEVRGLVERGFGYDLPAMSGIGYREVGMVLRGEIELGAARALIIRNTRRFVRRQYQWFRLSDPTIRWVNLDEAGADDEAVAVLERFGLSQRTRATM
jgi:tRNA dimethylallyltransferase